MGYFMKKSKATSLANLKGRCVIELIIYKVSKNKSQIS